MNYAWILGSLNQLSPTCIEQVLGLGQGGNGLFKTALWDKVRRLMGWL